MQALVVHTWRQNCSLRPEVSVLSSALVVVQHTVELVAGHNRDMELVDSTDSSCHTQHTGRILDIDVP